MEESNDLYRLEGTNNSEVGGLISGKKKPSDHMFKKPQTSIFGLDKLAEQKRRENSQEPGKSKNSLDSHNARRYRTYAEETPTYTGGVDRTAKEKLEARLKRQRLDKNSKYRDRERRNDRDGDRDRDRYRDRDRNRHGDSAREDRSSRRDWTPRFRDEPQTPKYRIKVSDSFNAIAKGIALAITNCKLFLKDTTSRTNWDDDDDDDVPRRRSTWDHPTPNLYRERDGRDSVRSEFTPSYKYNAWIKDRKNSGATPLIDDEEKELWEQEQRR